MRFALVDGLRRDAERGLSGICPICGSRMITKCGELRVWHWSHLGERLCDPWWENEGDWHRAWKGRFPAECQEIIRWSDTGEKHIADVRMTDGRVIEFQHSRIAPEERRAREAFYGSMVWIVNGQRRSRDRERLHASLAIVSRTPLICIASSSRCALVRDWATSQADVFLDLQDGVGGVPVLWHLHPGGSEDRVVVIPIPVADIISTLQKGEQFPRLSLDALARMIRSQALAARRPRVGNSAIGRGPDFDQQSGGQIRFILRSLPVSPCSPD